MLTGWLQRPAGRLAEPRAAVDVRPQPAERDRQREQAELITAAVAATSDRPAAAHGSSGSRQVDHGDVRSPSRVVTAWMTPGTFMT